MKDAQTHGTAWNWIVTAIPLATFLGGYTLALAFTSTDGRLANFILAGLGFIGMVLVAISFDRFIDTHVYDEQLVERWTVAGFAGGFLTIWWHLFGAFFGSVDAVYTLFAHGPIVVVFAAMVMLLYRRFADRKATE